MRTAPGAQVPGTRARWNPAATVAALGVVLLGACECEPQAPFNQLIPHLAPDTERVRMSDVYVGASREGALLFRSTGTGVVTIENVSLENGSPEDGTAAGFSIVDAGAKSLNPGAALEVRLAFAPVREGPASVTVVVESDAEDGPARIVVEANGLAPLDCGASTTCQRRSFDPWTGACVVENLSGPCDDENACTTNDTCHEGACLGEALVCPSPFSCTQGLCDAAEGCMLLAHDDRCEDDGNPCTIERCDVEEGCVREEAPDGTLCGGGLSCGTMQVCYTGACIELPVPDGTPCSDGDLCTTDDACQAGACVGTRTERPPVVAGEARAFGTEHGRATLLSGRRALFFDPRAQAEDGGYTVTLVEVGESGMQVLSQTDFLDEPLPARLIEASPGTVIGIARADGVTRAQRFDIAADDSVSLGLDVETPELSTGRVTALPDGRVVASGPGSRLYFIEPSTLGTTLLAALPASVGGATVGPRSLFPFGDGVLVRLPSDLFLVDLDGTVTELDDGLAKLGLVGDGDLLATATCADAFYQTDCSVILFDASFAEVNTVPIEGGRNLLLALHDGWLIVGRDGPAQLIDVRDPTSPTSLAGTLPWSAVSAEDILLRDGIGLFSRSRSQSSVAAPHVVFALDDDGLRFVTHPRWGSPGELLAYGGRLFAASRTSVHHLDVSSAGAPVMLAGAPLPRATGEVSRSTHALVRVDGGAVMPLLHVPYGSRGRLHIYEASVPALPPTHLQTLELSITGSLATNRRLLVDIDSADLLVFDLLDDPPEDAYRLEPRSETPLLWSLPERSTSHGAVVAIDPGNQIAVLSAPTRVLPWRAELLLFDGTNAAAPVLNGRTVIELETASAFDLAIAGPAVVITEEETGTVHLLHRLADGTLVETLRFHDEHTRILAFDGRTLVLGAPGSQQLSFWDVSGPAPIDLGLVELPVEPLDAEPFADTLVVSGQSSIVTLEPPCPPLP